MDSMLFNSSLPFTSCFGWFLTDIPIIPDLDDTQDEDMASQIAHAPL